VTAHAAVTDGIRAVLDANAPYWAGEAELCRTYFRSPARTLETDLRWLAAQAAKELVDGVVARADSPQVVAEETAHLRAFTAAYHRLKPPGTAALTHDTLVAGASWPANDALRALRQRHRRDGGAIGTLAGIITEGGAATLFREGAALAGRGGDDDVIAEACAAVLADEEAHAREAIDELARLAPDADGWATTVALTVEQSRQRLHMRAEQFGHPVEPARFAELLAGEADPTPVLGVLR
jgi:hypothetical protein